MLNKNFNNRKPDIWFTNRNVLLKLMKEIKKNYDSDDEKERENMFKKQILKFFDVIPMILIFIFLNF